MVHCIGIVPVFHIQINWNVISMAIAFLAAIHKPLFTIYQQHRNFTVTNPNKIELCSNMFYYRTVSLAQCHT